MRNFNEWLGKMRPSINNYNYYVDFEKVYANVENIRIELNIMNSLIGSKNIEADFTALLKRYPEILKCVPTLLAVRQSEIYENGTTGIKNLDINGFIETEPIRSSLKSSLFAEICSTDSVMRNSCPGATSTVQSLSAAA